MKIQLPPKRFQDPEDPIYDSVRTKSWFPKLAIRRKQIPMLAGALNDHKNVRRTQKEAAEAWGVDERELRDYESFVMGRNRPYTSTDQQILNDAYTIYCTNGGDIAIRACISRVSWYYGRDPRAVTELWEVDPTFFPTGYL